MRAWIRCSVFLLLASPGAHAQEPPRPVTDPPTCTTCRVQLRRIATLGDVEGAGGLAGDPRLVLETPQGNWIVAEYPVASRLLVYAPNGRFLQEVGRSGSAPGEFRSITAAYFDIEGRLHVFDGALRRETIFDSRFGTVRTENLLELRVHEAVLGDDGEPLFNADAATAEAIGYPIHRVVDGRVTSSFGSSSPVQRPDAPWLGQRALASAVGGVWVGRRTHYWLEKWTAEGSLLEVIERKADWFDPYLMRDPPTPETPPKPWINGIRVIGRDTLLVLIGVAAPEFAQRVTILRQTPQRTVYDVSACRELFDTRVELIDATSGRLLVSDTVDDCLLGFAGRRVYASRLENDVPKVDIFELSYTLLPPQPTRRLP